MRAALLLALPLLLTTVARADATLLAPFAAPALEEGERVLLDDALRAEVVALGGIDVVPRDDTRAACDAIPCDGADACSIARGARAGAASVIVPAITVDGGDIIVTLSRWDVVAKDARGAVTQRGPRARLRALVRAAVTQLLAPDRYVGRLRVELEGVEADVVVDGAALARTPMLSALAVTPARHDVEVRAAGLTAWRGFVDVAFDETATLALVREGDALVGRAVTAPLASAAGAPGDTPPASWLTLQNAGIATAVVGGVVLVSGAIATAVAWDIKARWNEDRASVNEARANLVLAPVGLVLLGVGALGVLTGGGLIGAGVALSDDAVAP